MSTLRNISNYFRLKQLEDMVINAERRFELMGPQMDNREMELYELRMISMITGRQSESTERIVRLFNPNADIYVGINAQSIEEFIERVREHNSNPHLLVRFINLNSSNIKYLIHQVRGHTPVNRVWLDVGGYGIYKKSSVMNLIIRTMDDCYTDSNPMYIIV